MKSVIIGAGIFLCIFSVGAATFVETFDNEDLENWREIVQRGAALDSWKTINNELHAINDRESFRLLTIGDDTWRDYVVEFDVKPVKKHGPGSIAIAARIKGASVLWCMIGDALLPGPEARVSCFSGNLHGGKFLLIDTQRGSLLKVKKWSTLKLRIQENNLTFWINGKLPLEPMEIPDVNEVPALLEEFETDFTTGGAGFGLSGYTALFDNIIITGEGIPNRGGLSVTPRAKLATTWGKLKQF